MFNLEASIDITHYFAKRPLMGVYILYNDIECRYVGESTNVIMRINTHYETSTVRSGSGDRKSKALIHDKIRIIKFIEVNNTLLRMVTEAFWHWKLKPTLNARPSPYPTFTGWSDDKVFQFIKNDFKSRSVWKDRTERRI